MRGSCIIPSWGTKDENRQPGDFSFHRGVGNPSRRAFTLIELTVVVAIVAVLAALLMPALQKAKAYSQASECGSKLRQIHMAFAAFAADHDDYFPYTGYWWRHLGDNKYVGSPDPPWGPYTAPASWPWVSSYRRWPVFRCPADTGAWIAVDPSVSPTGYKLSRMYDNDLCNNSYDMWWDINQYNYFAYYPSWKPRRFSVPTINPGGRAKAPLVMDCQNWGGLGWFMNYREWNIDNMSDPWKSSTLYAFRHPGRTANVIYLDGHIGTMRHVSDTGVANWVTEYGSEPER